MKKFSVSMLMAMGLSVFGLVGCDDDDDDTGDTDGTDDIVECASTADCATACTETDAECENSECVLADGENCTPAGTDTGDDDDATGDDDDATGTDDDDDATGDDDDDAAPVTLTATANTFASGKGQCLTFDGTTYGAAEYGYDAGKMDNDAGKMDNDDCVVGFAAVSGKSYFWAGPAVEVTIDGEEVSAADNALDIEAAVGTYEVDAGGFMHALEITSSTASKVGFTITLGEATK